MQTRSLPPKAWAAALPTLLTHQGFESMLCVPTPHNHIISHSHDLNYTYSQLERFLGSTLMRRHFHKPIEEHVCVESVVLKYFLVTQ